jgi:site-specific recombinase XerD
MRVTPILYARPLANGLHQIKIRIFDKGKTVFITTDIEIEKNKWDNKLRRVKELKSFPQSKDYNLKIELLISKYKGGSDVVSIAGEKKLSVASNIIFDIDQFLRFFRSQIEILEAQEKYTSYRKYKVVLNYLERFSQNSPHLKKIDRQFLDEFKIFIFKKGVKKINQNGFYAYFKVFRTFVNKIVDSGHENFKAEYNPFLNYKMREEPVNKTKLTKSQIQKIIDQEYEPQSGKGIAKFMFLFSFYSGGMRVGDLLTLQWKNIIDGRLEYTMRKTKKQVSFPLNLKQLEILMIYSPDLAKLKNLKSKLSSTAIDLYAPQNMGIASGIKLHGTPKKMKEPQNDIMTHPFMEAIQTFRLKIPEDYIFPLLKPYKFKTKTELEKMISSKTTIYNTNLRKISLDCELGVKLSSHIARHSFSDLIRVSGAGLYEISKILGHSDIAITQKYLKSLDQGAVDDAMNKFYGMNF